MDSPIPEVLLIADGFASGRAGMAAPAVRQQVERLVAAGVRWVQLRDHAATRLAVEEAVTEMAMRLRQIDPAVRISVNTHVDLAKAIGADLHVGRRGPSVRDARAALPEAFLSAAVHSREAAREAAAAGANALLFSPVFPTASKPGAQATGLDALAEVCAAMPIPVLALGGITPDRVGACLAAGAYGVAVLSGLLDATAPDAVVAAYLAALNPSSP